MSGPRFNSPLQRIVNRRNSVVPPPSRLRLRVLNIKHAKKPFAARGSERGDPFARASENSNIKAPKRTVAKGQFQKFTPLIMLRCTRSEPSTRKIPIQPICTGRTLPAAWTFTSALLPPKAMSQTGCRPRRVGHGLANFDGRNLCHRLGVSNQRVHHEKAECDEASARRPADPA